MRFTRNCQKNPRKTETPSASNNLVGFLRILKRKQNITQVSGKSTKDVTTYCREPAHYQELFRFVSAGLELEQLFLGLACPLAASLGGLGLICGVVSVITGEAGKKFSREVTKHEKTVSVCESKINSLKDRISKALADDRISDEEFENILAEMSKYHEMKKDIRVGFKNKVKKTRDGVARPEVTELRREIHAEILKKLALEEDRLK